MKHLTYHLFMLIAAIAFTACGNDISDPNYPNGKDPIRISLDIAPSVNTAESNHGASRSRRVSTSLGWSYQQGDELIQNWIVIMVNNADGKIEHIFTSTDNGQNKEEDQVASSVTTTPNNKTFYSFANISMAQLEAATGATFTEGAAMPSITQATFALSGNGYDPTLSDQGIPMTGITHMALTNADNEQTKHLYVVRMLAKIELTFTNQTGEKVSLNSVTIDRLTSNPTGDERNLMLFPSATPTDANTQVVQSPNLNGTQPQSAFTQSLNGKDLAQGASFTQTLYVNETSTPTNAFSQFMLTVDLTRADGTTTQQRYSVVSNENGEWSTIARNDWRMIPITLQDYKLDLIPLDFPAIGVLPSSVKEADGTFTCTFNGGGDFRLQPQVSRYSDGQTIPDADWTFSRFTTESYPSAPPSGFYAEDNNPTWFERGGYVAGSFGTTTGEAYHTLYLTHNATGRTLVYHLRIVRN